MKNTQHSYRESFDKLNARPLGTFSKEVSDLYEDHTHGNGSHGATDFGPRGKNLNNADFGLYGKNPNYRFGSSTDKSEARFGSFMDKNEKDFCLYGKNPDCRFGSFMDKSEAHFGSSMDKSGKGFGFDGKNPTERSGLDGKNTNIRRTVVDEDGFVTRGRVKPARSEEKVTTRVFTERLRNRFDALQSSRAPSSRAPSRAPSVSEWYDGELLPSDQGRSTSGETCLPCQEDDVPVLRRADSEPASVSPSAGTPDVFGIGDDDISFSNLNARAPVASESDSAAAASAVVPIASEQVSATEPPPAVLCDVDSPTHDSDGYRFCTKCEGNAMLTMLITSGKASLACPQCKFLTYGEPVVESGIRPLIFSSPSSAASIPNPAGLIGHAGAGAGEDLVLQTVVDVGPPKPRVVEDACSCSTHSQADSAAGGDPYVHPVTTPAQLDATFRSQRFTGTSRSAFFSVRSGSPPSDIQSEPAATLRDPGLSPVLSPSPASECDVSTINYGLSVESCASAKQVLAPVGRHPEESPSASPDSLPPSIGGKPLQHKVAFRSPPDVTRQSLRLAPLVEGCDNPYGRSPRRSLGPFRTEGLRRLQNGVMPVHDEGKRLPVPKSRAELDKDKLDRLKGFSIEYARQAAEFAKVHTSAPAAPVAPPSPPSSASGREKWEQWILYMQQVVQHCSDLWNLCGPDSVLAKMLADVENVIQWIINGGVLARLENLSVAVADFRPKHDRLVQAQAKIWDSLDELHVKFQALSAKHIEATVTKVVDEVVSGRIESVEAPLTSRIDSFEQALDASDTDNSMRFDQVRAKFDSVDGRIRSMEAALTQRVDDVRAELQSGFDSVDDRIRSMEAGLNQRVDAVRSEFQSRFDKLEAAVQSIAQRQQTIADEHADFAGVVTDQLGQVVMDHRCVAGEQTCLRGSVDALVANVACLAQDTTVRINALRDWIQAVEVTFQPSPAFSALSQHTRSVPTPHGAAGIPTIPYVPPHFGHTPPPGLSPSASARAYAQPTTPTSGRGASGQIHVVPGGSGGGYPPPTPPVCGGGYPQASPNAGISAGGHNPPGGSPGGAPDGGDGFNPSGPPGGTPPGGGPPGGTPPGGGQPGGPPGGQPGGPPGGPPGAPYAPPGTPGVPVPPATPHRGTAPFYKWTPEEFDATNAKVQVGKHLHSILHDLLVGGHVRPRRPLMVICLRPFLRLCATMTLT